MTHESLASYYKMTFALMQHHKYSLSELENMIPWEREVYMGLLIEWLKEEEKRLREEQMKNRHR